MQTASTPRRLAAAVSMGLAAAVPSAPVVAAPVRASTGNPVANAAAPEIASLGSGRLLMVTAAPAGDWYGAVRAYTGRVSGTGATATVSWGRPTLLGAGSRNGTPELALSGTGRGVVTWMSGDHVKARIRHTDGTWGPTYTIPRASAYESPGEVRTNRHGAVLISTSGVHGSLLALNRPGHGWSTLRPPDYGEISADIDDAGTVHVVVNNAPRGGDGSAVIDRHTVTGGWHSVGTVPTGAHAIEDARIAVTPDGHETVALGYVSPHWQSTLDDEAYWATGYRILTQDGSGKLGVVWKRDGAVSLDLTRRARRIQVTWRQWTEPKNKKPTHEVLRTQPLLPSIGAQTTLADQPASLHDSGDGWFADYARLTAIGRGGQVAVAWRAVRDNAVVASAPVAWVSGRGTHALSAPGGRPAATLLPQLDLAFAGPVPVAVWSEEITESGTLDYGIKLKASRVAAAALP